MREEEEGGREKEKKEREEGGWGRKGNRALGKVIFGAHTTQRLLARRPTATVVGRVVRPNTWKG